MWMLIIGLIAGMTAGIFLPLNVPEAAAPYLTVSILVCLDAVIGGARARQEGNFFAREFVEGFAANLALGCALAFLGARLDAQLYIAVAIALTLRIFGNFAGARRAYVRKTQI